MFFFFVFFFLVFWFFGFSSLSIELQVTSGEPGDRVQFSEFVAANVRLYALRNQSKLSTKAIANFARGELATALRKGPKQCNLLVAGYDKDKGPSLYFLDYLATMHKMNVAGYGYGKSIEATRERERERERKREREFYLFLLYSIERSLTYFLDLFSVIKKGSWFVLSMYDRMWNSNLTEEEALKMMELGIKEVQNRLVVASPTYTVKIVDANGIRVLNLDL